MNKHTLIELSFCAVCVLILSSLTNVIGYQTIQSLDTSPSNEQYPPSYSECACEKELRDERWHFPMVCLLLLIIFTIISIITHLHWWPFPLAMLFIAIEMNIVKIGEALSCKWVQKFLELNP